MPVGEKTTIQVSKDLRDSLKMRCSKGQSYEEYLRSELDIVDAEIIE